MIDAQADELAPEIDGSSLALSELQVEPGATFTVGDSETAAAGAN